MNILRENDGIYCIRGLPFTPNNAVATLDSVGGAIGVFLELGPSLVGAQTCPPDTQISVETYTVSIANNQVDTFDPTDNGFYININ